MTETLLSCGFCGKLFDDPRALTLPGMEERPPEFCPSCERRPRVVPFPGESSFGFPEGAVLVVEGIERNERRQDPRRKATERSRA
jgi:hypothetical protein